LGVVKRKLQFFFFLPFIMTFLDKRNFSRALNILGKQAGILFL